MSCLQKEDKLEIELNLQGESHCSNARDILKTFPNMNVKTSMSQMHQLSVAIWIAYEFTTAWIL